MRYSIKFLKGLVATFILSIFCMQSGVSAWTYTVYSQALKSLKGETVQAEMYKSTHDNQILEIENASKNRDIDFKISHKGDSDWINSTWQ